MEGNNWAEEELGLTEIRDWVAKYCSTHEGKQLCLTVKPSVSSKWILKEQQTVNEIKSILFDRGYFPFGIEQSISPILEFLKIEGTFLTVEQLFIFYKWLKSGREIQSFLAEYSEKLIFVNREIGANHNLKRYFSQISSILNDKGQIKDNASPELNSARREILSSSQDLRGRMTRILSTARKQGWTKDREFTLRNDRYVIPLKADFKGRIPGFIHDISQSGQTLFVEPSETLELNNNIKELKLREKIEVRRILLEVSDQIREELPSLLRFDRSMVRLDFLIAKGKFAEEINGQMISLDEDNSRLSLILARHPLLLKSFKGKEEKVIPLSLSLNEDQKIILISGPNAGGKTVTMKTLGLLALMNQSGFLLPCQKESVLPVFSSILVDIGDQQSIKSDLSTYTAHLEAMKTMLEKGGNGTLLLIDEFGSGTDPRFGGALAAAFLEEFIRSGTMALITTHYGNLKLLADQHKGIANGAMLFDPLELKPIYRIEVGTPGRSYAFEIAKRTGIKENIIQRARHLMDGEELKGEDLLAKLEKRKAQLEAVISDNQVKASELKRLLGINQDLKAEREKNKAKFNKEAYEKAQGLIRQANKKIENTIREIRESQAEKEKTKVLRKELAELLPKPPKEEVELLQEIEREEKILAGTPEIGDEVKIINTDTIGTLIEVSGKKAVIKSGDMRVNIPFKKLLRMESSAVSTKKKITVRPSSIKKKMEMESALDIRGLRVDESITAIDKFMDDIILTGTAKFKILHGKGGGILRESTRNHLNTYPQVRSLRGLPPNEGGEGWTVVEMKS